MGAAGVVTVADLLSRNAAVTTRLPVVTEAATTGVSVGSLLRREGRAPHAADRPVQPRGHQQIDAPTADVPSIDAAAEPVAKNVIMKRGAVAAGALLALGSVVGAAVLTEIVPTGIEAEGATNNSSYPGQGRLDAAAPSSSVLPAASVVDPGTTGNVLDAGAAPPTSWTPVAFPSAVAGVPAGIAGAGGAADQRAHSTTQNRDTGHSSHSSTNASGTTHNGGRDTGTGAGTGRSSSTPSTAADAGAGSGSNRSGGAVEGLGNGLGNTVHGVGDALPDAVGDPVEGLGHTVSDAGSGLDRTLSPVTSLLSSDDSARTSAPQQADEESSNGRDDDSSDSRGDDDRNDDRGSGSGSTSRDDGHERSSGLLGGVGKVAANLLGG